MSIPVSCRCGRRFAAQPQLAGRQVACPACRRPLVIGTNRSAGAAPAVQPASSLDDPAFWNQMQAVEAYSPALVRPERPLPPPPNPKPSKKRDPEAAKRAFKVIGGIFVSLVGMVLVIVLIYSAKNVISSGGFGAWEEYKSSSGRYAMQVPARIGAKSVRKTQSVFGMMVTSEGKDYGSSVALASYGDIPSGAYFSISLAQSRLRSDPQVRSQRTIRMGSIEGVEFEATKEGHRFFSRLFVVDKRMYTMVWGSNAFETLDSANVQKFFNSLEVEGHGRLAVTSTTKPTQSTAESAPDTEKSDEGAAFFAGDFFDWFSGDKEESTPTTSDDFATARRKFRTNLRQRTGAPQEWDPLQTPPGANRVTYRSGGLSLTAYVDPPPSDGGQRPGLVFLHGGFAFGDSDWEMAQPYRDAGFVVMTPVLRGENGQPGHFTLYFDEVEDVLAAATVLGDLPYVDKSQICIAGHSAGGSLTALAAMASDQFVAAASLCGCMDQRMNEDIAPFDTSNDEEFRLRSPLDFATSFQCPTRLYYGSQENWAVDSTSGTANQAKSAGKDVQALRVSGDHFTAVDPAISQSISFFRQHVRFDRVGGVTANPGSPPPPPHVAGPSPGFAPPPVPRPPLFPTPPSGGGLSGAVVEFQVRSFESRLDVISAARNALRGIPWVDPTRLEYAETTGLLTVGVRGSSVSTSSAKAALEQVGFEIGRTSFRNRQ